MGKKAFTLLEITICIAILSVAAVAISWEMKNILSFHHFQKNVDHLLLDLKKCQLIAIANQADIDLTLCKTKEGYIYTLHCDDPLSCFVNKPMKMKGVAGLEKAKKTIDKHHMTIYSSGRISPAESLSLLAKDGTKVSFSFEKSPMIELKKTNVL